MLSKSLIALGTGAALVAGITPSGFTPASNVDLMVVYAQTAATNGVLVAKDTTAKEPTISTKARLNGTSYAVIMIDLDIPSTTNPHTFLHWMQTDLTPATASSTMTTVNGTLTGFTLTNAKNTTAIVAYTQPGPPAQNPLSHRYTEILVDTSSLSAAGLTALKTAAATRVGFDINTTLKAAGLSNNVVAGNSFNVSNPGPATNGNAAAAASGSTTGKGGNKTKTKTGAGGKNTAAAAAANSGANKPAGNKATATGARASKATSLRASGTAVNSNLTSSGASKGGNSTGTVTTSGAAGGYLVFPATLFLGAMGAFWWAL